MKPIAIICIAAAVCIAQAATARETAAANKPLVFIENKGQITDQHGKPRRDIDYKLDGGNVTMFVGGGQLHYQWSSPLLASPQGGGVSPKSTKGDLGNGKHKAPLLGRGGGEAVYRMDVTLLGADKNAWVVAEDVQPYYENYYLPATPDGATAHSYRKITYKNVYPHIDWVVYTPQSLSPAPPKEGSLTGITPSPLGGGREGASSVKYDFIVHPGGNPANIRIEYKGATDLQLVNGALVAATPYGCITEDAPYSYDADNKEEVATAYKLQGNILSFEVANAADNHTLVIDPSLKWATYYGSSVLETNFGMASDTAGNVYITGRSTGNGNIATSGAFQTVYAGGTYDGYVAKFSPGGSRLWATYYGSSGNDLGLFSSIAIDPVGNIYMVGSTDGSGLATSGTHAAAIAGLDDALLVKFNSSGQRIWASYFGGTSADDGVDVACDGSGNVYIVGSTGSTGLATGGAHQPLLSSHYLAKFSGVGQRLWATYYGGGYGVKCDASGNVYCFGFTDSTTGIATTGAHRTSFGGAFIAKFTASGTRLWGTYYGSSVSGDHFLDMVEDGLGNLYFVGSATSTTDIATTGVYQTTKSGSISGNANGMLVKFSPTGTRLWGTYYGGNVSDFIEGLAIDPKNRIYIGGTARSTTNISTPGAYQPNHAGSTNSESCFMAVFNTAGNRLYGTYFGGFSGGDDLTNGGVSYNKGFVYIAGSTGSYTGIATTGAFQTSLGGSQDAFIAQFAVDTGVYIVQPFTDTVVCSGDTLSIPYGVTQSFRTTNNFVVQLSNASGSFASGVTTLGTLTGAQNGGVYNWVVPHGTTQGTAYRVRILATAPVDTATMEYNIRISTTPQTVNATSNTPVCSGNTINLSSSTVTSGVAYSWAGPQGFTSTLQNPTRANARTNHSGSYIVTFTNGGCISKDTTTVVVDSTPVAITASNTGPYCAGSDIQLNATNTTAGATYTWAGPASFSSSLQNPVINIGTLSNTGTYTVYAVLGSCSTAVANTVVSVVAGPTVNIYPSPNDTVCGNVTGNANFTAIPANAGTGFGYQWYKNGNPIAGATNATYAATGVLSGDVYNVKLIPGSGAPCNTPVNSNSIAMTVLPFVTPGVTITVNPDSIAWSGLLLTFTATPNNAGSNPTYQWKRNSQNQTGATSNTWGAPNLTDNDKITCEVTSSYICPQPSKATSNTIRLKISTGIKGTWAGKVPSIYPNPVKDLLIIKGITTGTTIQLTDVAGRTLIRKTAISNNETLNMQQLIPGNYMLLLDDTKGNNIRVKITKE